MPSLPHARRVLFICTGNCCRSQMAEALLRHMAGDRFHVHSAGTHPAGYIHPLTLDAMQRKGISTEGQFSKDWHEYAEQPLDIVITLCDVAALMPAPKWQGRPALAHWSLPDPSYAPGSHEQRTQAALSAVRQLEKWFGELLTLPPDGLTREQLEFELCRIAALRA